MDEDSLDGVSDASYKRLERKIVTHQLDAAVEDILQRKRFDPKYQSEIKRFVSCLDMDRDENIKRMNFLASKKMQNELDIARIAKKLRSFSQLQKYILSDRQRFLLKFNA